MKCLWCGGHRFTTYKDIGGETIWKCTNERCRHTFYMRDGEFVHTSSVEKA